MNVNNLMAELERKHPGENEYLQAVREVLESIEEVYNQHPEFEKAKIVERLVEPDRIFTFRVTWVDDKGEVQTNLGYRVQFNSAIGPYKGGLRFHKAVNPSMLKFLGFEQTFKNALTTLPMGGAKGGSDFDPTGKSNAEIMRFCQAFMLELWHNIGVDTDVPAGDVGVGGREIGFLNGMYQKLARKYHTGVLTGKGETWGGSILRPEATGFGALYFVQHMLHLAGKKLEGAKIAISGFGNVAWGASKKATELGAKVIAISGPDGVVTIPNGMNEEMIDYMLELRASNRNIVAPFAEKFRYDLHSGQEGLEREVRHRTPLRIPERAERRRCCRTAEERHLVLRRGFEHGLHAGSYPRIPEGRYPVRTGQGCQCGRCSYFGSRNDAELHAHLLVGQRGGRETPLHHGKHPRRLREVRQAEGRSHRLREGRQHRRLHESRTGYARAGCIVILFLYTKRGAAEGRTSFILSVSKNRGSDPHKY